MVLKVIVIGGGIGGLCAAVALRQAGHQVQVLEKSKFAASVGGAILICPNGVRVLQSQGFSFEKARSIRLTYLEILNGFNLASLVRAKYEDTDAKYGAPTEIVHRADLHAELIRLATTDVAGQHPVGLHLGAAIDAIDADAGTVELQDGTVFTADLIVGADGHHSLSRAAVADKLTLVDGSDRLTNFWFSFPTEALKGNEHFARLQTILKGAEECVMTDTKNMDAHRFIFWSDCRKGKDGGEVQSFLGLAEKCRGRDDDLRAALVEEFADFDPSIVELIKIAPEVKQQSMNIYEPFTHWHKGKMVLLGDAAHPMLPHGGQGASQALEDAGALGMIFDGQTDPSGVQERFALYQMVRHDQGVRSQLLSKVVLGREKLVEHQLRQYEDQSGAVPVNVPQRLQHDYGFNVFSKCQEVLQPAA